MRSWIFGGLLVVGAGGAMAIAWAVRDRRTPEERAQEAAKHTIDELSRCKPGQWSLVIETDDGRVRQRWANNASAAMMRDAPGWRVDVMGCDAVTVLVQNSASCLRSDLVAFDNALHDKLIEIGFTTLACDASGPRLELR